MSLLVDVWVNADRPLLFTRFGRHRSVQYWVSDNAFISGFGKAPMEFYNCFQKCAEPLVKFQSDLNVLTVNLSCERSCSLQIILSAIRIW